MKNMSTIFKVGSCNFLKKKKIDGAMENSEALKWRRLLQSFRKFPLIFVKLKKERQVLHKHFNLFSKVTKPVQPKVMSRGSQ